MRKVSRYGVLLAALLAACGDDGNGQRAQPTATATHTAPASPTANATPTRTASTVPTPTRTSPPISTATTEPTSTATPTATDTATATPSSTPSVTPTSTPTPTPTATATATRPPNQFGFTDDLLRVGAASIDISPLPAGTAAAQIDPSVPRFETFTDFDFTLACPKNPDIRLVFDGNARFDGVLTRPGGAEPFVDCGGQAGKFDAGIDVFADLNGNRTFDGDPNNPRGLEPFADANGNGNFDAIWLGGFDNARAASAIDAAAPLAATATVISKGDEFAVVITLDTIGNVSTHLGPLRQRIASAIGLDGSQLDSPDVQRIIVSSLHDHQAPDTLGLWGPTALSTQTVRDAVTAGLISEDDLGPFGGVPAHTGIDFTYRNWVDDQVVLAVQQAVEDLRVATLRVASAPAPTQPDSEILTVDPADQTESFRIPQHDQLLMTDIRWPFLRDPQVLAFQAREVDSGDTIVTLVNWANHVEAMGSDTNVLSADYAGYVRERLESAFGGVGVFVVAAVGGLQTPLRDAFVPIVDAQGGVLTGDGSTTPFRQIYDQVLDGQKTISQVAQQLFFTAQRSENSSPQKAASLGRLVAEVAAAALERESSAVPATFTVAASTVLVPIENPGFLLLSALGALEGRAALFKGEPTPGFVSDRPEVCGLSGCIRETLTLVDFGDFQFLTTPGEILPEYIIGRPRPGIAQDEKLRFVRKDGNGTVVVDFGENEFDPIVGLRQVRGGERLFIFGLAQSELGYFIPQSDFVNVFEGLLPRPEDIEDELGVLAELDLVPLLGLGANPGFVAGEMLSLRQIIETSWERFPEARYPEVRVGGVSLVDVPGIALDSHPNNAGNDNSVGPRTGYIVYNAMCDLLDDGVANRSCTSALPVAGDPNE